MRATTVSGRRSETTGLTYPEIATGLDVTLCDRKCVLRSLNQHTHGFVLGGVVHWKDRILVRRGLYTFLKLVAQNTAIEDDYKIPRVKLLWLRASNAYNLGLVVGVRFPREYAATDRAQVREELVHSGLLDRDLQERIERWSRE